MPYVIRPPVRKMSLAGALALLILAIGTLLSPSQSAAAGSSGPGGCDALSLSSPFAQFGDLNAYALIEGGSFERGLRGWSLHEARVVDGNERFYVRSPSDTKSLSIDRDGKVVSDSFCVDPSFPHLRFFARYEGASNATMAVRLRWSEGRRNYECTLGSLRSEDFSSWQATDMLPLARMLDLEYAGQTEDVRLVFDPSSGCGSWLIDDVYVDPYRR